MLLASVYLGGSCLVLGLSLFFVNSYYGEIKHIMKDQCHALLGSVSRINRDKRENLFSLPCADRTRNVRIKWQLLNVKAIR